MDNTMDSFIIYIVIGILASVFALIFAGIILHYYFSRYCCLSHDLPNEMRRVASIPSVYVFQQPKQSDKQRNNEDYILQEIDKSIPENPEFSNVLAFYDEVIPMNHEEIGSLKFNNLRVSSHSTEYDSIRLTENSDALFLRALKNFNRTKMMNSNLEPIHPNNLYENDDFHRNVFPSEQSDYDHLRNAQSRYSHGAESLYDDIGMYSDTARCSEDTGSQHLYVNIQSNNKEVSFFQLEDEDVPRRENSESLYDELMNIFRKNLQKIKFRKSGLFS